MKSYQIDLYKNSKDNSLRFVLGSKGLNPLIVIGLNPSTADENKPDMTISKIIGFAIRNNFDGFIMLNLYPQRATSPDNLDIKMNFDIHRENIATIFNCLKDLNEISILAAWGEPINRRDYLIKSLIDICDSVSHLNINWLQIGAMTKTGHPRHPSRATYDLGLMQLDIKQYISSLL